MTEFRKNVHNSLDLDNDDTFLMNDNIHICVQYLLEKSEPRITMNFPRSAVYIYSSKYFPNGVIFYHRL